VEFHLRRAKGSYIFIGVSRWVIAMETWKKWPCFISKSSK